MHWMRENQKENPLYEDFAILLDIALKYDVTLSLGDGFRPGPWWMRPMPLSSRN